MFNGHVYGWVCVSHTCVECFIVAINAATHHLHRHQCHHWKATRRSASDKKPDMDFKMRSERDGKKYYDTKCASIDERPKFHIDTQTHTRARLCEAVNASQARISSFNGIRCIFTANIRSTAKYLCENLWASSLEKQFNMKLCNLATHILPFRPHSSSYRARMDARLFPILAFAFPISLYRSSPFVHHPAYTR